MERLAELSLLDLIFLKTLAETRSLKAVAKTLDISVPGASRTLSKLRLLFDDELFVRSSPSMLPTARALELVQQIEPLIATIKLLETKKTFNPKTLEKTFHIAGVDNTFYTVMPKVVHALFEMAPNVCLDLRMIDETLFSQLESGELDLAIYPTHNIPPQFHAQTLYPVEYAFVVKKGHPLHLYYEQHGEVPLAEIRRYRKICITNRPTQVNALYSLDEKNFAEEIIQDLAISVPYFLTIPTLLQETNFTAILPSQTAQKLVSESQNLIILPYGSSSPRGYSTRIIWHDRVHRDPAMQWLRGLFATYATLSDTKTPTEKHH